MDSKENLLINDAVWLNTYYKIKANIDGETKERVWTATRYSVLEDISHLVYSFVSDNQF